MHNNFIWIINQLEIVGIEPTTFALSEQHSTTEIYFPALSYECANILFLCV